jgi:hypothetical protein
MTGFFRDEMKRQASAVMKEGRDGTVKNVAMVMLGAMVVTAVTGCSLQRVANRGDVVPATTQSWVAPRPIDAAPFYQAMAAAQREQVAGNTEAALRLYQQVLDSYSSPNGELETAVATNASIAALDAGDRPLFIRYAEQTERSSQNIKYLGTNTQVVLSLLREFRGSTPQEGDGRIQSGVSQSVTTVLGMGR